MSIDVLAMNRFRPDDRAVEVALPLLAVECECTPPLENELDVYEDTVLRLLALGLPPRTIAGSLNATESLIDTVLENLRDKQYAVKKRGESWSVTKDGQQYFDGTVADRKSDRTVYGYMLLNPIKKNVLPYFYEGALSGIPLADANNLHMKLTLGGEEEATFADFPVRSGELDKAFRKAYDLRKSASKKEDAEGEEEYAEDLFADLESFEEIDDFSEAEEPKTEKTTSMGKNLFVRRLSRPPVRIYLTMRILIDPSRPDGYTVDSPLDYDGEDRQYFLRLVKWMANRGNILLGDGTPGDRPMDDFLNEEIRKISPRFGLAEKDYNVFLLEKLPVLRSVRNQFPGMVEDMGKIYDLMCRQDSLIEQESIINSITKSVLEPIFNYYLSAADQKAKSSVSRTALADLKSWDFRYYLTNVTQHTALSPDKLAWSFRYVSGAVGKMSSTGGNSISEKLINIVVLNFYLGTEETGKLLSDKKMPRLYELTDSLNQIRRKVVHDTDSVFTEQDYKYYMAHVFELINGLLEAVKER